MDMENQKRVLKLSEEYGPENIVVLLGAAEAEAAAWPLKPLRQATPLTQVLWQESSWD